MTNGKQQLQHVLVVDDDDVYNFLTEDTFSDTDLDCKLTFKLRAQDALDFLDRAGNAFPDAIFLDINMPAMNGWEFLEEYEKRNYHVRHPTPIIMISSSVYHEDKEKARGYARVIDYVEKPLSTDHIERIREAVESASEPQTDDQEFT